MAKIKQYRPAFFEGFENQTAEFNSSDELINIDWVKSWRFLDKDIPDTNFHQYSISDDGQTTLIGEFDNGKRWYVVGVIDDISPISELPLWRPNIDVSPKD